MDTQEFIKYVADLRAAILEIPAGDSRGADLRELEGIYGMQTGEITEDNLRDYVDAIRLRIKYLGLDVEATRRQKGYLEKMLKEDSGEST